MKGMFLGKVGLEMASHIVTEQEMRDSYMSLLVRCSKSIPGLELTLEKLKAIDSSFTLPSGTVSTWKDRVEDVVDGF